MRRRTARASARPRVVVTAGPTREPIDAVRFISNYSTGTFGYEIAAEAARRGCRVTLISGPTALAAPRLVRVVNVESALEMRDAVRKAVRDADCLIMAAAVSDWRPRHRSARKLKRRGRRTILELTENPDILREAGRAGRPGMVVAGFALETEGLEKNALAKLRAKRADFIVANRLDAKRGLFGDKTIDITIFDRLGKRKAWRGKTKKQLAKIVLDKAFSFNI